MKDIYEQITRKFIDALEGGNIPWQKPWSGAGMAISHATGKRYSLLNQLLLGKPGEYLTFKQVGEEGGKVKKGAKSKFVVFWQMLSVKKTKDGEYVRDANGDIVVETRPVLRYYNVFHIDDCEGIEPKYAGKKFEFHPIQVAADTLAGYISSSGVTLRHEAGDIACYCPSTDTITLPTPEQFEYNEQYYATAFHEAVHSTGHKSRLDRLVTSASYGKEDYSREELVAEIGSASIMMLLGIDTERSFRNAAGYVQGWLTALKNDKRLVVTAAGRAEKAVQMILGEV